MTQQRRGPQQVRIIGGKWKGQKLRFSGGASLRPTLGRTRETLFNWLRPTIQGTRCLDAFAGSGILGFEALSQGAASVVLVEQNPRTIRSLETATQTLNAQTQCKIIKADLFVYLRRLQEPFDIVFLDPPFSQPQLLDKALKILHDANLVSEFVYAESKNLDSLIHAAQSNGWEVVKQTRTGGAVGGLLTSNLQPGDTKANIRGQRGG